MAVDPLHVLNEIGRPIGTVYIDNSTSEENVGAVVINPSYPRWDPARYYDGEGDWTLAINTALSVEPYCIIDLPLELATISDTLVLHVGNGMRGRGREASMLLWTFDGDLIHAPDARMITLEDFAVRDDVATASRTNGAAVRLTSLGDPTFAGNFGLARLNIDRHSGSSRGGFYGVRIEGGTLMSLLVDVRCGHAKQDAFYGTGPVTSTTFISCYGNAAGRDGYRAEGNWTYSAFIATGADAPGNVGYNFIGDFGGAGNQRAISMVAVGCEVNGTTATTENCLRIEQGRDFDVQCNFGGSSGLNGDAIKLVGDAGYKTRNIRVRGVAQNSATGYGINADSDCEAIVHSADLSSNFAGETNGPVNQEFPATNPLAAALFAAGVFHEYREGSAPSAPSTNGVRVYSRDNGGGKTQLVAVFPTGAVQVIATEP